LNNVEKSLFCTSQGSAKTVLGEVVKFVRSVKFTQDVAHRNYLKNRLIFHWTIKK